MIFAPLSGNPQSSIPVLDTRPVQPEALPLLRRTFGTRDLHVERLARRQMLGTNFSHLISPRLRYH